MSRHLHKQSGISLFIVLVVVLLTSIVVAISLKTTQFGEMATGNSAEYQRTYEAAQSLVHDAEMDIKRLSATGSACSGTNCRTYGMVNDSDTPSGKLYFPLSTDLTEVQAWLNSTPTGCIAGICRPLLDATNQPYAFWENAATLSDLKKRAAHYGQYTAGTYGASQDKSNPRLNADSSWYWVELLPYNTSAAFYGGNDLAPTDMDVVYRITALVEGQRNTTSIIQKIVVGKKAKSY